MTHFDWELEQAYDRDLIVLLETLKRVDLKQFAADLKANDKKLFNELTDLLIREKENAYRG